MIYMAGKNIRVSRYRSGEYIVNYDMNGRIIKYKWAGSTSKKVDTKSIPDYVVDWLITSTNAIKNGSLVIEKDEASKEITDAIDYDKEKENVVHTRKEVEAILIGNTNTMKAKLSRIENESEKNFVVDIAKEIDIDSVAKREFLAEWIGVDSDMLFAKEED